MLVTFVLCRVALSVLLLLAANTIGQQRLRGILINGLYGTQLYDPFNAPHAHGKLTLGLSTGMAAQAGCAVIDGQLAYFLVGESIGVSSVRIVATNVAL